MLRLIAAAVAVLAGSWAAIVWLSRGLAISLGPIAVTSRNPTRPLIVALIAAAIYVVAANRAGFQQDLAHVRKHLLVPSRLAGLLSIAMLFVGFQQNSWTASGADGYAYVSQADLWVRGSLRVHIPLAEEVPWPNGIETFTPFGYRPSTDRASLVPVTAPGLPMLMAAAHGIAGHCAKFWIGPIAGALLVWLTFAIGRRVASDDVGLGAAWIVATSPVFLSQFRAPMSDVPAAAFWALAIAGVLGSTSASALGAGLAAVAAILIRPNLAPLALILLAWIAWRSARLARAIVFAAPIVPAVFFVAMINDALYGSAFTSGYGGAESLFTLQNVPVNLRRYTLWTIETQTPLALAGLAALFIPSRRLWPRGVASPRVLACFAAAVWAAYVVYLPFDAWWYVRFLLPSWPAMAIGMAAIVAWAIERVFLKRPRMRRWVMAGVLLALGAYNVFTSLGLGIFPIGERDRRYASIAEHVMRHTEPDAVVITAQHAGSIRYYTGRLTLRFDLLDEAWLDRAVAWLEAHGRHPYLLLEDWEVPRFEQRFAGRNELGRVSMTPVLAYKSFHTPDTIYLFDPRRPYGQTDRPVALADPRPRCVQPFPNP